MDLVLRGGKVIDGTGAPGRAADVAVEGDRIVAVGDVGATNGAEVVDLDGLVLAPGFVDIHTHYDAQVTWDGDLTPSCWHGVTSVVMGNCGFSIAPTRPEDRGVIARTLENVEGMTLEALEAGIDWSFETFPEYLDAVDRTPKRLNVASLIGHTPLRRPPTRSSACATSSARRSMPARSGSRRRSPRRTRVTPASRYRVASRRSMRSPASRR
jgi:N-acyl-D-aspartate/D-glutamate deacylase